MNPCCQVLPNRRKDTSSADRSCWPSCQIVMLTGHSLQSPDSGAVTRPWEDAEDTQAALYWCTAVTPCNVRAVMHCGGPVNG